MENENELERLNREFKRDAQIAKTILAGTVLGCLSYPVATLLGAPDDFLGLVALVVIATAATHVLGVFK